MVLKVADRPQDSPGSHPGDAVACAPSGCAWSVQTGGRATASTARSYSAQKADAPWRTAGPPGGYE